MRALLFAIALTMSVPGVVAAQATEEPAVVAEARAFMDTYARELIAGDRAAVAARYDRSGAWMVRSGVARRMAHDAIVQRYAERWRPPAAFEWRDLTFIPSGEDAVTVVGRFVWTAEGREPELVSFHGRFVREDGELLILVEDETPVSGE